MKAMTVYNGICWMAVHAGKSRFLPVPRVDLLNSVKYSDSVNRSFGGGYDGGQGAASSASRRVEGENSRRGTRASGARRGGAGVHAEDRQEDQLHGDDLVSPL